MGVEEFLCVPRGCVDVHMDGVCICCAIVTLSIYVHDRKPMATIQPYTDTHNHACISTPVHACVIISCCMLDTNKHHAIDQGGKVSHPGIPPGTCE